MPNPEPLRSLNLPLPFTDKSELGIVVPIRIWLLFSVMREFPMVLVPVNFGIKLLFPLPLIPVKFCQVGLPPSIVKICPSGPGFSALHNPVDDARMRDPVGALDVLLPVPPRVDESVP